MYQVSMTPLSQFYRVRNNLSVLFFLPALDCFFVFLVEEEFFLWAFFRGMPQGTVLSAFDLFVGLFDSAVVLVVAGDTETKIQQTKPKMHYNMANAIFAMGCTSYKCYGDKK